MHHGFGDVLYTRQSTDCLQNSITVLPKLELCTLNNCHRITDVGKNARPALEQLTQFRREYSILLYSLVSCKKGNINIKLTCS